MGDREHTEPAPPNADARSSEAPPASLWGKDALSEREALLREAERIAHVGSWAWDMSTGRVAWSDELYAILGRDPARDEATFDDFMAAIHPDDRRYVHELSQRAAAGHVAERADFRIVRDDGSMRDVTGIAQIFRGPDGTPRRMVGTVMDVTDARRAERARQHSLTHLEDAQRLAHVGSWTRDVDADTSDWSDELRRILALPPGIRPSFEAFLDRVHPDDRALVHANRKRLLEQGGEASYECRLVWPNGEVRNVLIEIRLGTGRETRVVGTVMDLTRQKRLERQLAQAQKMEALGRISGGVAHDFNNLLTIIMLNVRSLMQQLSDERLDRVHEAAVQGASLTRQLTTFSRQNVVPRAGAVDLNAVARATLELAARVLSDDIETSFAPSNEPAVVVADEGQMHQVLLNLVVNARDAMPSGGSLEVATAIVDPPDNLPGAAARAARYVRLSVRDTGGGMDEGVKARIFEPFFTTKEVGKGSGLGLATVFGIVAQNGGALQVDSTLGKGTTMHVLLPLADASVLPRAPADDTDVLGGLETLLVVEDDPRVRASLCATLSAGGYDVLQAGRPSRVFELWREHGQKVSLLISDVAMPEMSGHELAAKLRAEAPDLPILFVTGHEPAPAAALAGARWLAKPFTSTELLRAVRGLLGSSGS